MLELWRKYLFEQNLTEIKPNNEDSGKKKTYWKAYSQSFGVDLSFSAKKKFSSHESQRDNNKNRNYNFMHSDVLVGKNLKDQEFVLH